jgi:Glycosyltransferase family 87
MNALLDRLTPPLLTRFFLLCLLLQFGAFLYVQATPGDYDRLGRVRGRDFLQFYAAGALVLDGRSEQLYDDEVFSEAQAEVVYLPKEARYHPLYPPATALLAAPFALLPFTAAVCVWWICSIALFAAAARLLAAERPPAERRAVWLGLFAFQPVVMCFWDGQLSALWLLAIVVGLRWHGRGLRFAAGLVFSVVALKPQLALGLGLWLLLRRDIGTLLGLAAGTLLQQALALAALGAGVLTAYVENIRVYADLQRMYHFDPSYQHALFGVLMNYLGGNYTALWGTIHVLAVALAMVLVLRVIRWAPGTPFEAAVAVLLLLLAPPHLLLYDLALLAVPINVLAGRGSPLRGPAALLYLAAMAAPAYRLTSFSVVPAVLLLTLWRVSRAARHQERNATSETSPEFAPAA